MGVMDERSSRIFVGVCLLVLLWIGTYWVYDPSPGRAAPSISFDVPEQTSPSEPRVEPSPAQRPSPRPDPAPITFEPPPPTPDPDPGLRVAAPQFREHTVRAGETFETIAARYFGSERYGPVVARANPLRDPRRLRAGDVVRVPLDPGNVQGVVVRANDGAPAEPPPPEVAPDVEYIVKAGDSLSRIAQSYYGSVRHADFIFQSNRDVLSSPDRLRVGQVLRLPPLPPGD